jgi:uncharacterized membrane protein
MLYLLQIIEVLLNLFVFLISALTSAVVVYVLLQWLLKKSESAARPFAAPEQAGWRLLRQ